MHDEMTLEERIVKARGNLKERNQLIHEFMPFIIKVTYERTGRPVHLGEDEEVSIAMSGFDEAIERFELGKGRFLAFARAVIRFRLADYYRITSRHRHVIQVDFSRKELEIERADLKKSVTAYLKEQEDEARRDEIIRFNQELAEWGLTLEQLVSHSPGQQRTRQRYQEIARLISRNEALYEQLIRTRRLPVKEIQKFFLLPRKRIETGRIYIIGLVIILKGDYLLIRQYIPGGE